MSVSDYVIDVLLIAVIFRQVRPRELTLRSAVLPLVLMVAAGVMYLRTSPLGGNDVTLIVILAAAGVLLGLLSGSADRLWRDERGRLLARAGRCKTDGGGRTPRPSTRHPLESCRGRARKVPTSPNRGNWMPD